MEYTFALWIKAIAYIIVAVFLPLGGFYMVKKHNWKKLDFIIVALVAVFIAILGIKNTVYAVNPKIEHSYLQYQYSSSSGEIFGRTYYFVDNKGNDYELTMDVITNRKALGGNDLKKNAYYDVGYEKHSNTITSIKGQK